MLVDDLMKVELFELVNLDSEDKKSSGKDQLSQVEFLTLPLHESPEGQKEFREKFEKCAGDDKEMTQEEFKKCDCFDKEAGLI